VPITTHQGPLRVPLPDDASATGLHQASFAKCETVGPLHKSRLKTRIGRLPLTAWPDIEAGLCRVLGLPAIDR
jgi:mRNA-degrading endonuclease toxin of MazEF toxin-antitoxin module